jgi:hypothetical protein
MKTLLSAVSTIENAILQSVLNAVSSDEADDATTAESEVNWTLPGFGAQCRVGTSFGDLPIEALRVRDEIRTASGTIVRVQWIDKIHLDEDFVRKHPSAQPIRIPANAFGTGKPMKDMIVSPQQPVCPDMHAITRFPPAVDLCNTTRAMRVQTAGLTYYRFHCGNPVTVKVEGVWVRV